MRNEGENRIRRHECFRFCVKSSSKFRVVRQAYTFERWIQQVLVIGILTRLGYSGKPKHPKLKLRLIDMFWYVLLERLITTLPDFLSRRVTHCIRPKGGSIESQLVIFIKGISRGDKHLALTKMLPKVATHILHSTSRAAAAVQTQSHTIRNVLHGPSTSTGNLGPWNGPGSSSSNWGNNGPGPGGQKYNAGSSRFYYGYTVSLI